MARNFKIPFAFSAFMLLAACAAAPDIDAGQYWERANMGEAVYAQGPNAQQVLDRDISGCVVDLREQEDMASVKRAIPADARDHMADPDYTRLAKIDRPDHVGALLTEQSDYHDFEGCMLSKGWERTGNVPYEVADRARLNWYKANVNYGKDPHAVNQALETSSNEKSAADNQGQYSKLND